MAQHEKIFRIYCLGTLNIFNKALKSIYVSNVRCDVFCLGWKKFTVFNWWAVNSRETFWKQLSKKGDCFWIPISIKICFLLFETFIQSCCKSTNTPDRWCHCRCSALTANGKHLPWHQHDRFVKTDKNKKKNLSEHFFRTTSCPSTLMTAGFTSVI